MTKICKAAQRGYTLSEVLIVVIIIAIMASLAIPRLLSQGTKAGAAEAINMIGAIKRAEGQYYDAKSAYLTDISFCSGTSVDTTVRDTLGIDLSEGCATNKWSYTVDSAGATITATSVANNADTLYHCFGTSADKGKWGGTGDFHPSTGKYWPGLQDSTTSAC